MRLQNNLPHFLHCLFLFYSEKTGKTYDATVLLADTGGKYVNYRVERKE